MPPSIFSCIGDAIQDAIDVYLAPTVANTISAITPVAIAGVGLYLAIMGYMVVSGAVQEPLFNFLKQSAKILLVAACALHADTYMQYVVESLRGLESGLMTAVSNGSGAQSSYQVLDQALEQGIGLARSCFEHANNAGMMNLGAAANWVVAGLCTALGSLVVTILAGANIIIAKCALVIVCAVGPLFVMSLMWPVTARFFDSWFSQVLNYTFSSVLSAVVMSFALAAFGKYLKTANFDDSAINPIMASLEILAFGAVLTFLMLQVNSLASGLAGGMGLSTVGISFLTAPFRAAGAAARGINARSNRLDVKSGQMVNQSRLGHMADGNTVLNPRYRQALLGGLGLGRNWGRAHGGSVKKS